MRIWKYTVPVDDEVHSIRLRVSTPILGVEHQGSVNEIVFWAYAPESDTLVDSATRRFLVVGTGQKIPVPAFGMPRHHGVVQAPGGLVWHLLEV